MVAAYDAKLFPEETSARAPSAMEKRRSKVRPRFKSVPPSALRECL